MAVLALGALHNASLQLLGFFFLSMERAQTDTEKLNMNKIRFSSKARCQHETRDEDEDGLRWSDGKNIGSH